MTALSLPRPRRVRPFAFLVASLALVGASQIYAALQPAGSPSAALPPQTVAGPLAPPEAPVMLAPGSITRIDHSIAAWTANLAANDRDFLSAGNLGLLYEARARLSGDVTDYERAMEAADRSLAIEPRQLDVQALHARVQLATHDFSKALAEAEIVDRAAPAQPAVLAIIGDARLELGDLDGAALAYDQLANLVPGPAVTARLARIDFLRGDPAGAVSKAEAAYADATAEGQAGPALSWYAYLAGTLSLSAGAPDNSAAWFDKALAAWPESFMALAGRARAAAAIGDVEAAIRGYRAAIAIAPQPEALTALGDMLALQGEQREAEQHYDTVLAIARLQGGADGLVYNRQLVLFNVNHDRDTAEALTLAERELAERKDAYGYDAHAWALLANGRAAEADASMARALAFGTRDATLLYHAGEIARTLGHRDRARGFLEAALAIRGALDPLSAARAAAVLEAVR